MSRRAIFLGSSEIYASKRRFFVKYSMLRGAVGNRWGGQRLDGFQGLMKPTRPEGRLLIF